MNQWQTQLSEAYTSFNSFYNSLTYEEKADSRAWSAHKNTNEADIQSFHNSILKIHSK